MPPKAEMWFAYCVEHPPSPRPCDPSLLSLTSAGFRRKLVRARVTSPFPKDERLSSVEYVKEYREGKGFKCLWLWWTQAPQSPFYWSHGGGYAQVQLMGLGQSSQWGKGVHMTWEGSPVLVQYCSGFHWWMCNWHCCFTHIISTESDSPDCEEPDVEVPIRPTSSVTPLSSAPEDVANWSLWQRDAASTWRCLFGFGFIASSTQPHPRTTGCNASNRVGRSTRRLKGRTAGLTGCTLNGPRDLFRMGPGPCRTQLSVLHACLTLVLGVLVIAVLLQCCTKNIELIRTQLNGRI